MSDLNILFPTQHIDISGITVTVKPFTFGQLPKVLKKAQTIYSHLAHLTGDSVSEPALVIEAMAIGGDDLIELVCMSIDKDRDFIDQLSMDDGVKLVGVFLEVNLSFFVQRVLPEFKTAMSKVQVATGVKS